MSVKLKGDHFLDRFMANWDSVLAGMRTVPDVEVLEVLFYNQIKSCHFIKRLTTTAAWMWVATRRRTTSWSNR